MIDLQAREAAGAFTLSLRADDQPAESYDCDISVCPSPTCGCEVLTFDCAPGNEAARQRLAPFAVDTTTFHLDLDAVVLAADDPEAGQDLGKALIAALDEPGWQVLSDRMMAAKQPFIDGADPDQLVAEFPFKEIEDESLLVGWYDIFPLARRFVVGEGVAAMGVDDAYCVAPGCDCDRAAIELFPSEEAKDGTAYGFDVDFARKRWTDPETGREPKGRSATQAARLRQAHPEIEVEWARRRGILRRLYAANRGRWLAEVGRVNAPAKATGETADEGPVSAPKVGRNAPCPCGSGKKYKRCCGR